MTKTEIKKKIEKCVNYIYKHIHPGTFSIDDLSITMDRTDSFSFGAQIKKDDEKLFYKTFYPRDYKKEESIDFIVEWIVDYQNDPENTKHISEDFTCYSKAKSYKDIKYDTTICDQLLKEFVKLKEKQ